MKSDLIDFKTEYPLTSQFLNNIEFSELSKLYFQNFPDETTGFYLPSLLKSLKNQKFPEFIFELADFENSLSNLIKSDYSLEKILTTLNIGDVALSPATRILRFDFDILTYHLNPTQTPIRKPNVVTLAKNTATQEMYFFKMTPETACIVDYLTEGKINYRVLSAQILRNFSNLFKNLDQVHQSFEKLKKHFIVLEK